MTDARVSRPNSDLDVVSGGSHRPNPAGQPSDSRSVPSLRGGGSTNAHDTPVNWDANKMTTQKVLDLLDSVRCCQ